MDYAKVSPEFLMRPASSRDEVGRGRMDEEWAGPGVVESLPNEKGILEWC